MLKSFSQYLKEKENPDQLIQKFATAVAQNSKVKETPAGSNNSPEIKKMLSNVGINSPAAWCAAFVSWIFDLAFSENPPFKTSASVLSMWKNSPESMKINIDSARKNTSLILPGMIFIKSRGGAASGKGHTGIVLGFENDQLKTIEGNTNDELSGEGHRVGLNIERGRKLSDSELLGFIDPFLEYRSEPGFNQKLTETVNAALRNVGVSSNIDAPESTTSTQIDPAASIQSVTDPKVTDTIPAATTEEIKSNPIMRNMIMGITKMALAPVIAQLSKAQDDTAIAQELDKFCKDTQKDPKQVANSVIGSLKTLDKVGLDSNKIAAEFGLDPLVLEKIVKYLNTLVPDNTLEMKSGTPSFNAINQWSPSLSTAAVSKDLTDFIEITKLVIAKLEGGYYHPDMLKDGRVKDTRYSGSGETMYGLDRFAGHGLYYSTPRKGKDPIDDLQYLDSYEYKTPAAKEFWETIDSQNARSTWKWGEKGPSAIQPRLLELAAQIIKPEYERLAQKYLSPEALALVNSDGRLLFNFIYATWNGSGWFQKFANKLNDAVKSGIKVTDQLVQVVLDARVNSGNSLVAQGGKKIANLVGFA
jgi:hypothetical protein